MDKNISVYITSYNQKEYLLEAIESVLNQTFQPFEILIVDDCSSDGSQKLIKSYGQKFPNLIKYFLHKKNIGIPKNRNFALKNVKGDLETYLDGDDRFLPNKLELELETLSNHPEAQIVYSNFYFIDKLGNRLYLWANQEENMPSGDIFIDTFANNFPRGTPFRSEMVSLPSFLKIGTYNEKFKLYEDWDIRIRLTKKLKVAYCKEPLSEYRLNPIGISNSNPAILFNSAIKVYEMHSALLHKLKVNERRFIQNNVAKNFVGLAKYTIIKSDDYKLKRIAYNFFLRGVFYSLRKFEIQYIAWVIFPKFLKKLLRVYKKLKL